MAIRKCTSFVLRVMITMLSPFSHLVYFTGLGTHRLYFNCSFREISPCIVLILTQTFTVRNVTDNGSVNGDITYGTINAPAEEITQSVGSPEHGSLVRTSLKKARK